MIKALTIATTIAFSALATDVGRAAEVDQIAQQKMIGLAKNKILACLGAPAKRVRIGATEIWTYPIGEAPFETLFFSPALSMGPAPPSAPSGASCNVNIVMTNGAVTQVVYHGGDGGPLPLGRECQFPVAACAEPAQPVVVRAAY
jgi:hypothetical protein